MTIQNQSNSITVVGTGTATLFSFPFVADSSSDITVSSIATNGQITLLSPTTYTVNVNSPPTNQIWGVGGSVIYPLSGSPLPAGQSLIISRVLPFSQQITTQNQGNYYAQVTEQALDTLEMQIQQLASRTTQFRGIWITGTLYNAGDIVQDGVNGNSTNNYYICSVSNTSGVWATDLAAGDWAISALAAIPTGVLTLTGDVTGTGSSPIATTLSSVNSNIGTFSNATVTTNAKGLITAISAGSNVSGTVTSVTFTGDGTVLSSTPSAAVTSSGTVTGTLISQAKNTIFAGPTSGSNANPTFRALGGGDISLTPITSSISNNVSLNNTSNFFDGPSVAQGTSGTWYASGTVTLKSSSSDDFQAKLWDGTTVIASAQQSLFANSRYVTIALSGQIASPVGNLRISVRDSSSTAGTIITNDSGSGKDSTITAFRIA